MSSIHDVLQIEFEFDELSSAAAGDSDFFVNSGNLSADMRCSTRFSKC